FLKKLRVSRQFEGLMQMRFQIMKLPEAIDRVLAHSVGGGHRSTTPMGLTGRPLLQCRANDLVAFPHTVVCLTAPATGDLPYGTDPFLVNPLPPQAHRMPVHR